MNKSRVPIIENILSANDRQAAQNQAGLNAAGVYACNFLASPGAGKTSVILRTISGLSPKIRLGVIEGDTAPVTIDADRVLAAGCPAVQINTGGECHLDAVMVAAALPQLPLNDLDLLIVENVGNLVCTGAFRLGTHANILIASVPEGDDKPYKYPAIYRGLSAVILNKIDLLPYIDFNLDYFRRGVELLNPGVAFFPISCRTGEGVASWLAWLVAQRTKPIATSPELYQVETHHAEACHHA
jgi:hydrogenase nickel incorporation protein HypB